MTIEDLQHHYRIIDMVLTMHSVLRDRYSRRALWADLLLLLISIVLNALVFLDPSILDALRIGRDASRVAIGICSVLLFFLSLVVWRVDWKERGQTHAQAAEALGKLKLDCRSLLQAASVPADRLRQQVETCVWVLSGLPKIPEDQFVKLKAAHKRKVKLSQLLDSYPGAPVLVLRARMMWEDVRKYLRSGDQQSARGGTDD